MSGASFQALVETPTTISCVETGTAVDATSQTTYTFAGVSIGANPSATRFIVVALIVAGTPGNFSSCTIGGSAATQLAVNNTAGGCKTAFYGLTVAAGTTATIAFIVASAGARAAVVAYALDGLTSTTPTATASATSGNPMVNTLSAVNAGGAALAIAGGNYTNAAGTTWTGVTLDVDSTTGGVPYSSASKVFTAPQSSLGANATLPGTPASQSSLAISLR